MKVWIKLLIGSLLGILVGFFLPADNQSLVSAITWLEALAIRIGRYAVVPILFFSLTIAIYELRQDGQFWPLVCRSFLVIIGSSLFIITAGILVTLFFTPARIPIPIGQQHEAISLGTAANVTDLFPPNMFAALGGDGVYLLPVYLFAFFLGMGLSYDRSYTKPVITMTDSLSRIFYHIASFFSEILGLVMIFLAAYWAVHFHAALKANIFRDLIVLLGIFSVVLGFGILPLFLYLLKPKINPWAVLYGSLGPAVAAYFSGDINFSLPVLIRHARENHGVRRRSNAVTLALFSTFGRAGSVMVAAAAFIVVIKSYSYLGILGIGMGDIFILWLRALLISLLLARHPGDGAYTALAVLCIGYGKSFEAGYLLLKPLAFYLVAVGTFIDVMVASFASCALARAGGFQEDKSMRHYI
ncbi:MAG: dicarboxylate/amino acid:cation symporter [Treponema sp.]|jgi:Na+/H+-dicarboxylate symporter|nr:dicarboxylate/amino acid:cation symporter [Treponema sp.]